MMLIRTAARDDLPSVLEIYNEAVANSTAVYTETPATLADRTAWFEGRQTLGYPVLVAEEGGLVAGFASFGDFRPWPGYRFTVEHGVYVHKAFRRRGIGSALTDDLAVHATALNKHVMVGGIDAANEASIRMHQNLGFVIVGQLSHVGAKFGRWLDLVLMTRRLDERRSP